MGDSMDINITIENCIFSFNCTQKWIALDVTVDNDIKFCRKCEKKVYLCKTDEDLNLNVKLGNCVAIFNAFEEMPLGMILEPEKQ